MCGFKEACTLQKNSSRYKSIGTLQCTAAKPESNVTAKPEGRKDK